MKILKSARDSLELVGLERFPNVGNETSNVEVQATANGEQSEYGTTRRGLKSRHIQLIALGGCIGTGLFVGTGSTLSLVGPAHLFMGMCCV